MSITHKQKKTRRMRGSRTHGWGAGKKHRGAGSRGGRGNAGSGKRGQQKKTEYSARGERGIGAKGFVSIQKKKVCAINVGEILPLAEHGTVDLGKAGYSKLLGAGRLSEKLKVLVEQFSEQAKAKVEAAGGEIIIAKVGNI